MLLAPARVLRWLAAVVSCPWFFTVGMELQLEELGVYIPSSCAVMQSSREGVQLTLSESCLLPSVQSPDDPHGSGNAEEPENSSSFIIHYSVPGFLYLEN